MTRVPRRADPGDVEYSAMAGLEHKAALVTGGPGGIGRAIAERLAADGAAVVFSYLSNADAAADVVAGITAAGGTAHAVQADLADPGAGRRLFDQAESQLGPLDILVNNAGVVAGDPIARTTGGIFDTVPFVDLEKPVLPIRPGARRAPEY